MGFSTRVSNELGAGNPQAARLAVAAVMFLTVSGVVIISSTVFASRSVFGYIFSKDKEVVDYVTSMAPLICLSVISDNLHGVLSGYDSIPSTFMFMHLQCSNSVKLKAFCFIYNSKQVLLGDVDGRTWECMSTSEHII